MWDGTAEVDVTTTLWDGAEEDECTVRGMPFGYGSVAAMLATSQFKIAHRGGSKDWQEMTLPAYTESVARGVGALEVSLARTSDGVWIGHHDETLLRVAGVNAVPASRSWAQIQALMVDSPESPADEPRPFATWQQITQAYHRSHVLFVDPKYNQQTHRAEFLDMLEALPYAPKDRVVVKYSGDNTSLANAARARGFKTWGYYYHSAIGAGGSNQGMLAATQASWDILGVDYTAPQATYDLLLAYGKPLIAHIVPDAAAAASAFAKGADGLMVSGVRSVVAQNGI